MKLVTPLIIGATLVATLGIITAPSNAQTPSTDDSDAASVTAADRKVDRHAERTIEEGRHIFRFDTFGDEAFWGDTIKLHQAI